MSGPIVRQKKTLDSPTDSACQKKNGTHFKATNNHDSLNVELLQVISNKPNIHKDSILPFALDCHASCRRQGTRLVTIRPKLAASFGRPAIDISPSQNLDVSFSESRKAIVDSKSRVSTIEQDTDKPASRGVHATGRGPHVHDGNAQRAVRISASISDHIRDDRRHDVGVVSSLEIGVTELHGAGKVVFGNSIGNLVGLWDDKTVNLPQKWSVETKYQPTSFTASMSGILMILLLLIPIIGLGVSGVASNTASTALTPCTVAK